MPQEKKLFSPCSERDVRAAALKATHEHLKTMDDKGLPTIGKFGEILKEESAKIRAYGEKMAKEGTCQLMTWDELKKSAEDSSKKRTPSKKG